MQVARHATAEQPEELDRVLGLDDVGVPDEDQRGRADRADVLGRPVELLAVERDQLTHQRRPFLRIGSEPQVLRFQGRAGEGLGRDGLDRPPDLGIDPAAAAGCGCDHELAHHVGMAHGDLQRDTASHTVAENVGALAPEVLEQRRDVVRQLLVGQRPIDVGRAPVALELDRNDLPRSRQNRDQLPEVALDRSVGSVQQHQRLAAAVDLVVHPEAVHRRVSARQRWPRRAAVDLGHHSAAPDLAVGSSVSFEAR